MLRKPDLKTMRMNGETGKLADKIIHNWLLGLRESNPAILDMFRDRELLPYRDLLPWSGEFAGKYITGAYYIYQITRDELLFRYITGFIDEMLTYQDDNGYLGCYRKDCQLTGAYSQNPQETGVTWDSWAHYHTMAGLLLWYKETGNETYLTAVKKIANLFLNSFYDGKHTLVCTGCSEMNLAVYHSFAVLYNLTGAQEYIYFARKIEEDLTNDEAGNYINLALEGCEYYQCPRPRWESMHVIMGIAQMYLATGEKRYLTAVTQIVHSILKTDVHNTGAFSTDERAIGNPYTNSNIETCCVIAYNALVCEVLLLTGELKLVDFLERSHFNAVMGYFSPSGRWSTYNTPMDGVKCANYHSIVFQSRSGSPDLNCCSVNAPRGVGNIAEWALLENHDSLCINHYEPFLSQTKDGLQISVTGDYPCSNTAVIHLFSGGTQRKISLRIPEWSAHTRVVLGEKIYTPDAGTYLTLEQIWNDDISVNLDFTPRIEAGEMDCAGKSSIFIGPILYAYDRTLNPDFSFEKPPIISISELSEAVPIRQRNGSILLSLKSGLTLTDFYHAGYSGCAYKTWLNIQ